MAKKKKVDDSVENIPHGYTPSRDALRNRVRKHVTDKNDKITDDDIRNVKVDAGPAIELSGDAGIPSLPETPTALTDEEKKAEDDKKHITPWDVLGE